MPITETLLARYRGACQFGRMNSDYMRLREGLSRRQLLAGSALIACVGPSAFAQIPQKLPSASATAKASHSSLRLLTRGTPIKPGVYTAAIAIDLSRGFKTYWRHPGDSGVPPTFNFTASANLASAEVLFPAPKKFADGAGGHSFGYDASEVIFPVIVTAVDPAKPVMLELKADYAVCESICILASAEASLLVSEAVDEKEADRLTAARLSVPAQVKLDSGSVLKIKELKKAESPESFLVDVRLPADMKAELFLEGEAPWFFETKSFTRRDAEHGSYLVNVIERSKAADCTGAEVTLTLVSEKSSIEVTTRLDLGLVTH